ncbi:MAG: L,D-transpeptidase family protein [Erythrobacter sp.]|uniref:L,D-transpeptidase family protein n=1 Tax=Erythrobacter sp. TaxID=1042 RepID=UPI002619B030|nr:L,D-transpeptidase family protein [Erythrobacter sp.]MDJ0976919.1 L,D-transpeptidase family protein [Erythrobacter sp.]
MRWNGLLFLGLAVAACSGPPEAVVSASGEGVPARSDGAVAARSIPATQGRLVADYLLVDKSDRLLIAYRAGQPIRAYRDIQFGDRPAGHKRFEGDERTPEGRYTIDWRNPQSRYHLSLRISYPNAADRAYAARYGRSPGGDIFIHGQPNQLPVGRLPGDWTDGCIALSNAEIEELWQLVPDGTVIDIRP